MCMKLKKIIKLTLITLVLGNVLSTSVFAVEISSSKPIESSSILFDTDNPNVGIEIYNSEPTTTFGYKSASAWKTGRFYLKRSHSTLGEFKTTGKFTYDGTICNVTDCKNSIWNVADGWRVKDSTDEKQISPTFAKAVGTFELYKEGFFGDKLSSSATITISCNHKGKTNCEFNGDESVN